ncbi:MAG TPA: class II aldolase/adducin family protein [Anaerolineales bacterium]|nr:class II aldolase/adducin family protein [Anaerolineales bacterium]
MGRYDSYKSLVVETAQLLTQKGYLMATGGNLSVRVRDEKAFAITPSNYDYMKMLPEDVCILDLDLNVIEGKLKPSVESAMHGAIYQTRADVNAVVHTHQVYASALSLIKAPIPALFDEQTRFLGRSVEIIPYAPSGTGMLKNTIAKHIQNHNNAYIMQNHGALCFGHDMERAAHNVEILEKCSLAYLLAICAEKKVSKVPLAVREIAFSKLRKDQKKVEQGISEFGGE